MDPIKEAMIRDDDGLSAGANTPLTPMGMARELVEKWHTVNFGLKIEAWKLEMLASRIAELMVANTLEAIRELEDYNGKHQRACLEIERLTDAIWEYGQHRSACRIDTGKECDCGFFEIIKSLDNDHR